MSETAFRPVRRITLTDAVVNQLKALILEGKLNPGDRIPSERELCAELEVSRTALREAKRSLITMGLLEARPGKGTFVRDDLFDFLTESLNWGLPLEEERVSELIEARKVLEVGSAGLAAERATPEDREALTEIVEALRVTLDRGDRNELSELDLALHTAIAEATQNAVLMRMTLAIRNLLRASIRAVLAVPGGEEIALYQHLEIVEAIVAQDAERTRGAMERHLADVERTILQQLNHGE